MDDLMMVQESSGSVFHSFQSYISYWKNSEMENFRPWFDFCLRDKAYKDLSLYITSSFSYERILKITTCSNVTVSENVQSKNNVPKDVFKSILFTVKNTKFIALHHDSLNKAFFWSSWKSWIAPDKGDVVDSVME